MKKIFLVLMCVALAGTAQAQLRFGIKGGMTFSDYKTVVISGSSDDFWDSRTSWNAGIFGQYNMGIVAIQQEILFAEKGTKGFKLQYLDFPLSLRISPFGKSDLFTPFIIGGGYLSYAIDGNYDGENDHLGDFQYKKLDYGAGFGAGFDLFNRLQFTARYDWGFGKVGDAEHFQDSQSRVFSASLGIYF